MAAALAGIAGVLAGSQIQVFANDDGLAQIAPDSAKVPIPRERVPPGTKSPEDETEDVAPAVGSALYADLVLDRYASQKGWNTELVMDGKSDPEALRLFLPSPIRGNPVHWKTATPGTIETILPLQPQSYRKIFRQIEFRQGVAERVPFRRVDASWSTTGLPDGSDDSAATPHYQIHFVTTSEAPVAQDTACSADDETCEPVTSKSEMTRRLRNRPGKCFLPRGSMPVAETAAPEIGLFNLASGPEPTDASADENPVIGYGTFDNRIVFIGVSLTLSAFQNAAAQADLGERLSWPISQPA